jgi:hypothetical protein
LLFPVSFAAGPEAQRKGKLDGTIGTARRRSTGVVYTTITSGFEFELSVGRKN